MPIEPRDHAESVALFRHSLIGFLATQTITRGQLIAELRRISEQRHRLPDNDSTRSFSVPTLQRWVYALRRGGIEALRPAPRSDRGRGQRLTPELRELLCDIRREHRDVSVSLILTNLRSQGRIGPEIKPATVRRMLADKGLTRAKLEERAGPRTRLRWQAERPGLLWHGDVCHGPTLKLDGKSVSMRIHALLDDASRYVVGLRVVSDEREAAMLRLLASAVKEHGMPQTLYLDNGSTYRGQSLSLFCARLGGALMHARPYDPQARGKMERFWGTMRGQVLDHIGQPKSLLEVEEKLWIWLRKYYLVSPHAGLLGQTPACLRLVQGSACSAEPGEDRPGAATRADSACSKRLHARRFRGDIRSAAWISRRTKGDTPQRPAWSRSHVARMAGQEDRASPGRYGPQRTSLATETR